MNKFGTLIFVFVLLLFVGNVYSIDHSLGSDLDIKPSVIDKMKKEKFTYSYKELKNKKKDLNKKCSTLKGKFINVLNKIAKGGEYVKSSTEKAIDNCDKKKVSIYFLVGAFVLWYIRRVIKNSFFNKKKVNIYFNESGTYRKEYQELSYPYYDSNTYLSNNNQYLNSYNPAANEAQCPSQSTPKQSKSSRFFSQRKRKNSNDDSSNLYSYAYV